MTHNTVSSDLISTSVSLTAHANTHKLHGRKGGGMMKILLTLLLICSLCTTGCGKDTDSVTKTNTSKQSTTKTIKKRPFDISKVLELYEVYSSEMNKKEDLLKIREAGDGIEQFMNSKNESTITLPNDFECKVTVDDDYDTNGIQIILNLPIRVYAASVKDDPKIKKVTVNNSKIQII